MKVEVLPVQAGRVQSPEEVPVHILAKVVTFLEHGPSESDSRYFLWNDAKEYHTNVFLKDVTPKSLRHRERWVILHYHDGDGNVYSIGVFRIVAQTPWDKEALNDPSLLEEEILAYLEVEMHIMPLKPHKVDFVFV